jgi:hypothetical protein
MMRPKLYRTAPRREAEAYLNNASEIVEVALQRFRAGAARLTLDGKICSPRRCTRSAISHA